MKRTLALVLTLLLTLSTAAIWPALASDVQSAAEEILASKEYLNVYKTSFSSSYPSFNYYSTAYATVRSIVANCIDGLVEPDIYGVYVPSIAESWETNEDETVWTFKIREGVNWVDHEGNDTGLPVTAEDFVDGIRRPDRDNAIDIYTSCAWCATWSWACTTITGRWTILTTRTWRRTWCARKSSPASTRPWALRRWTNIPCSIR